MELASTPEIEPRRLDRNSSRTLGQWGSA